MKTNRKMIQRAGRVFNPVGGANSRTAPSPTLPRRTGGGRNAGTVLIFVVALLVLLALMGTAYLATARLNRLASAGAGGSVDGGAAKADPGSILSAFNVVIGTNIDSLKDSLIGKAMLDDVLGSFDPDLPDKYLIDYANDNGASGTNNAFIQDYWLGSRLPVAMGTTGSDAQTPKWQVISRLAQSADFVTLAAGNTQYPYGSTTYSSIPPTILRPSAIKFTYDTGIFPQEIAGKTRVYPAFSLDGSGLPGTTNLSSLVLAADADGDGIADSGLIDLSADVGQPGYFTVPGNSHTGPWVPATIVPAWPNETSPPAGGHVIHYLAAVRVVDNNAAVNANTAWRLSDYQYDNGNPYASSVADQHLQPNYGFFRSNIGMLDLYHLWDSGGWNVAEGSGGNPGYAPGYGQSMSQQFAFDKGKFGFDLTDTGFTRPPPIDDTPMQRSDYAYGSLAETLEMGVNRRPGNPSYNGMGQYDRYATFSPGGDQSIAASLAFRAGLLDPQQVAPTRLESWLYLDTYWFAPNFSGYPSATTPYRVKRDTIGAFGRYSEDKAMLWFNYNYNYDYDANGSGSGSRATFFNSNFGLSGAAPTNPLMSGLPPLPTRPLLTTYNPTNNIIRQPARKTGGNDVLNTGDASATPPTEGMATYAIPAGGDVHPTKIDINSAPFGELWRGFWDVMSDPTDRRQPEAELAGSDVFNKGFLSNVTASGADGKTMIMQLRSALAAVNAEQMRVNNTSAFTNGTHNIISHNIQLVDNTGNNLAFATVYGSASQPFIVHVEASVARATAGGPEDTWTLKVKLFNPYEQDITPAAFRFVIYDHNGKSFTKPSSVTPNNWYDTAITHNTQSAELEISFPYTAAAAGSPATLPDMDLMLIRTRDATGNAVNAAGGQYDETGDNFKDWVPCDRVALGTISISDPADSTNDPTVYDRPADGSWDCAYAAGNFVKPGDSSGTFQPFPMAIPGMAGPNGRTTKYPFGQFARAGEIMLVPFVGSYRIEQTAGTATEMIPITYDVTQVGMVEPMIGRFTPPFTNATDTRSYWGRDLFDVFTARENPANDYLPAFNVPDTTSPVGMPAAVANLPNEPASDVNSTDPSKPEHDLGTAGLININTAPAQVLAMLPMAVKTDGTVDLAANYALAQAIVQYRQAHGPFHSLFELNNVTPTIDPSLSVSFVDGSGTLTSGSDPDQGNILRISDSSNAAFDDFYKNYATLCRISNLATTRSDTFTVYVLIQAWQIPEAQTDWLPVLIGQERRAYIVDRSQVNLNSRAIQTQTYGFKEIPVPTR